MAETETCYNRGCGSKYNPDNNPEDVCRHHPGMPFFHDAYKGWSCCNKKCIDFTEFLNIKGCTLSSHSNVKPEEPVKQAVDKDLLKEAEAKVISPIRPSVLVRPSFDSPLTQIVPVIAASVKQKFEVFSKKSETNDSSVEIGTSCKNGGCKSSFQDNDSNSEQCIYHPGVPIFHEGLKYWSCCEKRTTDFNTFLNQPGCTVGLHKWKKEKENSNAVNCRWDWHQTASHVVISIYAKSYDPINSFVKLNPIRLKCKLIFPDEGGAVFDFDIELRGIIDVNESKVEMLGAKVEVKLRKAEPGSWAKVDFPREKQVKKSTKEETTDVKPSNDDPDIDLDDIEAVDQMYKVNITEVTD